MKYFKLFIIPLMALCFNVAFAGPPECYKGKILFKDRQAFLERVEKYHAQDLVNNKKRLRKYLMIVPIGWLFWITYSSALKTGTA
ncbi:Uncharacterised protein [Moraxella lacunata]|uniref:Uncharacterized protein n=1 Tax=Moraxella lacunata TaxID=477 RepID=A0A378TR21_MORLA|nr:hypothetical protein [Moraxella lacunata]STZ63319.1 Uncharacterised protein [Moraxella lacunata]